MLDNSLAQTEAGDPGQDRSPTAKTPPSGDGPLGRRDRLGTGTAVNSSHDNLYTSIKIQQSKLTRDPLAVKSPAGSAAGECCPVPGGSCGLSEGLDAAGRRLVPAASRFVSGFVDAQPVFSVEYISASGPEPIGNYHL